MVASFLKNTSVWQLVYNEYVLRMIIVATFTVLVYDYLLTFNDEKELVWESRNSVIKFAFLLNRFLPLIGIGGLVYIYVMEHSKFLQICIPGFWTFGGFIVAEYLIAEFILFARAYAVWGCKRPHLLTLGMIYIVISTIGLYYNGLFLRSAVEIPISLFPNELGCLIFLPHANYQKIAMILVVVAESIALSLLIAKAIEMPASTLMKTMFQDGIFYFINILCASIANLVVLSVASPGICGVLLGPQAALHSICCSRILLRIRRTSRDQTAMHSINSISIGMIHFSQEMSTLSVQDA